MLRFKSDCSTKFKLVSVIFPFSYSHPQNDFKLGTEDTSLPSDYQLDSNLSSTLRPDDEDVLLVLNLRRNEGLCFGKFLY